MTNTTAIFINEILIVEDNPQMRNLIRSEVAGLAARFHEASDGADAIALYSRYRPDWVLMDLEMKETDGLSATRQIIAAHPDARICIVTNYDDELLREEAQAAGACGFCAKANLHLLREILTAQKTEH